MNPVLIFLVILGAILLWFLCAFIFRPLGSFIIALITQALNTMEKDTYINPNSENDSNSKNKEKEKYE